MTFAILPISCTNPDIDMINLIEKDGMEVFVKYVNTIQCGTCDDIYYFKCYLHIYLFGTVIYSLFPPWVMFIHSIHSNKDCIKLIDYIENEKDKITFVNNIVTLYYMRMNTVCTTNCILLDERYMHYIFMNPTDETMGLYTLSYLEFLPLLHCHRRKKYVINWLNYYYKSKIWIKSFDTIHISDLYNIDAQVNEIMAISMCFMETFNSCIIKHISDAEPDLLFMQTCFTVVHNYLELSVLNLIRLRQYIRDQIIETYTDVDADIVDHALPTMSLLCIDILDKLLLITYDDTKCYEFYTIFTVREFMSGTLITQKEYIDAILSNTFEYLEHNKAKYIEDGNPSLLNCSSLFDLCMKVIDYDNPFTSSNYIKLKAFMVIVSYSKSYNLTLYVSDSCQIIRIITIIVNLYNNISDSEEFHVFKHEILEFISPYKYMICSDINKETAVKFVHNLLENYESLYTLFIEIVKQLHSTIVANQQSFSLPIHVDNIEDMVLSLNWYQTNIFKMDEFMTHKPFLEYLLHVANKDKFAYIIGMKLKDFIGKERKLMRIDEDTCYFDPIQHLTNIYNIFNIAQQNDMFIKTLAYETRYMKTEYIDIMLKLLVKKNIILIREMDSITETVSLIESKCIENVKKDTLDIPDDLLDPIMGTLIENPVLLPNSDIFMDNSIILRHLMAIQNNPFTREPLTVKELNDFNETPDTIVLINKFKKRLVLFNS